MKNADYWNHKTSVYLHDPVDKALRILGHQGRAAKLREIFDVPSLEGDIMDADWLASALDRAMTPGYHRAEAASGAIDFLQHPVITHPTGNDPPCHLQLPAIKAEQLNEEVVDTVRKDLDLLSAGWQGRYEAFALVKYLYLHLRLRHRLAETNVGGLGAIWYRLPADTRIPDHSIWQHNALVSALDTCQSEGKGPALMVYSIAPVQPMIAGARKLRDFWTGSVLISWLAFEGIRAVATHWGPDHIVYPSLCDQPLVDFWLNEEYQFSRLPESSQGLRSLRDPRVASFPNKFVALVPEGHEENTASLVRNAVETAWLDLGNSTLEFLLDQLYRKSLTEGPGLQRLTAAFSSREALRATLHNQFQSQVTSLWEHSWASLPLLRPTQKDIVKALLGANFPSSFWQYAESSLSVSPYPVNARHNASGAFYPVTHRVVQTALAASKSTRWDRRPPQEGIKCSMDPEFSILTVEPGENPLPREDLLWAAFREVFNSPVEFAGTGAAIKESERLSAVSTIKRFAHRVCRREDFRKKYVLHHVLYPEDRGSHFESTTEMALADWFVRCGVTEGADRRNIAQLLHDTPGEDHEDQRLRPLLARSEAWRRYIASNDWREPREAERYFAFVVMDGDKMGDLINGATIASRWKSVLHPQLVSKMRADNQGMKQEQGSLVKHWDDFLEAQRSVSPALHASISEALGDFSIYGVSSIVNRHRGRLVYAGGDDVCAVFPVSEAIDAVLAIESLYRAGFVFYQVDQGSAGLTSWVVNKAPVPAVPGKLAVHLGLGPKLTISAAIVFAHHKAPLAQLYQEAQHLLKHQAKEKCDRSGLALRLQKRSGTPRVIWHRLCDRSDGRPLGWWQEFRDLALLLGRAEQRLPQVSGSLLYRLEEMKDGLDALVQCRDKFQRFVAFQLERSGLSRGLWPDDQDREKHTLELAEQMVRLSVSNGKFNKDVLLVARFLGERLAFQAGAKRSRHEVGQ